MAWKNKTIEEQREYHRRYWANHPEYRARQVKLRADRRHKNKEWLAEYKADKGCLVCGESDPVVLDFHHRDGSKKDFNIATSAWMLCSRKRIMKEVVKCDVMCANCHRRLEHHKRASSSVG